MAYVTNTKFVVSYFVVLVYATALVVSCEDRDVQFYKYETDVGQSRQVTDVLLKQFVGTEAVPMTEHNIKYVSQYAQLLFTVLQDDDDHHLQSALAPTPPTPSISTIKGEFSMYNTLDK